METKQIFEVGEGVSSRWRTSDRLWEDGHQLMLSIKAMVCVCVCVCVSGGGTLWTWSPWLHCEYLPIFQESEKYTWCFQTWALPTWCCPAQQTQQKARAEAGVQMCPLSGS